MGKMVYKRLPAIAGIAYGASMGFLVAKWVPSDAMTWIATGLMFVGAALWYFLPADFPTAP